ncbi:molybdenum ABC transporter ATP-binding protein [Aliikangiella marina]|uniref:molybdenum ABC transporter ATP-binding protein n=1 Tax=Aliikangiella marina TaxID=1712262 RepID=UPI00163D7032|nr:molybdenum ABC transporter ATP-binding protein [Aliikangiella marina]
MSASEFNATQLEAKVQLEYASFKLAVDFKVPLKGVVAIYGPSGCGKTTLLRCLAGLEKASYGEVTIGDQVWQNDKMFVRPHERSVGFVFQDGGLLAHLTVAENLNFGRKRAAQALDEKQCRDVISLLGLEPLLTSRPAELSGGEAQRVAIGRALFLNPQLLIMDEPLASLDSLNKDKILSHLDQLKQQADQPMIYVSHSASEISRLADYVIVMDQGEIQYHGTIETVAARQDSPFYQAQQPFSVLFGQVVDPCNQFKLSVIDVDGDQFMVPDLALEQGRTARLHIDAKDVSLALSRSQDSSILNIFKASVVTIEQLAHCGHCLVKLSLAQSELLALISQYSCEQLSLAPGSVVFAQIKAVSILK